jgi:hypothetical protein
MLFWAQANWQPLCAYCYARKTENNRRPI